MKTAYKAVVFFPFEIKKSYILKPIIDSLIEFPEETLRIYSNINNNNNKKKEILYHFLKKFCKEKSWN